MAEAYQCSCRVHSKLKVKAEKWSICGLSRKMKCFIGLIHVPKAGDNDSFRSICLAVQEGRSDDVKKTILLDPGMREESNMRSIMMMSLHGGMFCIVDWLVEGGLDSGLLDDVLLACSRKCDAVVVARLLKLGADVNTKNRFGLTALHMAAERGGTGTNVMSVLLKNGAEASPRDNDGKTPLHVAVRVCCFDSVRMLVESGAELDCLDNQGCSLLHEALKRQIEFGEKDIAIVKHPKDAVVKLVRYLVERIPKIESVVRMVDKHGNNCIHYAVQNAGCDHFEVINLLIEVGCPINVLNGDNLTPLRLAVLNHKVHAALSLLQLGADVDAPAPDGSTPLHAAVSVHNALNLSLVNLLLEFDCDVDTASFGGITPFHILLYWPVSTYQCFINLDSVFSLIQYGANIFFSAGYRPNPFMEKHCADLSLKPLNCILYLLIHATTENALVLPPFVTDTASERWSKAFFKQCVDELALMKRDKIGNFSYYELLICETDAFVKCLRNSRIRNVMESEKYLSQFRIYGVILEARYKKALRREELIEKGFDFFRLLADQGYPSLPEECAAVVLDYLKDSHLNKVQAIVERTNLLGGDKRKSNLTSSMSSILKQWSTTIDSVSDETGFDINLPITLR